MLIAGIKKTAETPKQGSKRKQEGLTINCKNSQQEKHASYKLEMSKPNKYRHLTIWAM